MSKIGHLAKRIVTQQIVVADLVVPAGACLTPGILVNGLKCIALVESPRIRSSDLLIKHESESNWSQIFVYREPSVVSVTGNFFTVPWIKPFTSIDKKMSRQGRT